ncbi:ErmE/ErmH/ErmO/ErmR family 23S rRNA (adenine(2058)-N(6))-methyltransferase [Spongiactinospora sp. TRM90649]|uniref:ErmE/ErmH/ErmO/ErmR family 23S rRNA (adenine(2058)-N(6))-methyltransferase n=1 Tax=Spongiactinospora sp. TRM90649 TaxID=3031114 RepID=UPI0023F6EA2B|nr:ErmE/ErmH/ErmO/ErmR family 23S rRNA (adenine(2058)-N(6))-methyltransferase [Spongiactinospora sp. TRM90649]MDF5756702.1 ErmE/ErmH/ErmO/ErmR family 23S rRNA (adenine(2058)-N(6))-methyltransferase [Spongiactinospora sp. TRM90649]
MARPTARTRTSTNRPNRDRDGGRGNRRRTLSQNFLTDRREVGRILRAARLRPGGLILEPGPGEGALTFALAGHGPVIAYELDPALARRLARRTGGDDRITVVAGDFTEARPPARPFAVVGNIPYSATTAIVAWCLRAPRLTCATLVTQLEYARKRTGDYGRWSKTTVASWPRHTWHLAGRIDRRGFDPVPSVDSAILHIRRRPADLLPPDALGEYRELVELGFSGVGGSLRASLRRALPPRRVDAALRHAGVERDAIVAYVHPDQWVALFDHLAG